MNTYEKYFGREKRPSDGKDRFSSETKSLIKGIEREIEKGNKKEILYYLRMVLMSANDDGYGQGYTDAESKWKK